MANDLMPFKDFWARMEKTLAQSQLCSYLLAHEDDIAWGINDFDTLTNVFTVSIGRSPEKAKQAGSGN